ncbi:unnamed protein product, partial [Scytosiphon promiscuus]
YDAFLSKLTFVNVDSGFGLANSCILTTDFYDRLMLATVGPLLVFLVLTGTFCIARRRSKISEAAGLMMQGKHVSAALVIVFLVYSSASFTIFQTFVCERLDDGASYLRADYSITCSGRTYEAHRAYASLMACIYPIGIPAFFGLWLLRNRQELETPDRETRPHLQSFRCLWAAYRPSRYYYEVVECGRRIVLTGVAVFVLPDSEEQIAIVLLLAVVFMFVSESLSPFENKLD